MVDSHEKWMSLVIAAALFMSMLRMAYGETAQFKTTERFISYLESQDVKYSYLTNTGDLEAVSVSSGLDNFESVKCTLIFDADLEQVGLRFWKVVKTSAGKNYILSVLNDLNSKNKFAKFVFDEDDSQIDVELDMVITVDNCTSNVFDSMLYLFAIIDKDDNAKQLKSLE